VRSDFEIADEPLDGSTPSASCAHERIEPLPFRAVLLKSAPFPELTDSQRRAIEMLGGVWERAEFGNDTGACSAQIGGIPLPVQAAGLPLALTRKVRRLQRFVPRVADEQGALTCSTACGRSCARSHSARWTSVTCHWTGPGGYTQREARLALHPRRRLLCEAVGKPFNKAMAGNLAGRLATYELRSGRCKFCDVRKFRRTGLACCYPPAAI